MNEFVLQFLLAVAQRSYNTPGPADSWPTSDEEDYNFDNKVKCSFVEVMFC